MMMNYLTVLLMQPSEDGGGGYQSLLFLLLIIVVFYMFFIRPQMKKSKDLRRYRENLKKGDRVITIGGIHGKIVEMQDKSVTIEVEGQNRLKIEKSAIAMDGPSETLDSQRT